MARKPTTKNDRAENPDDTLVPPKGGAAVRMYRIGHGDCFLIAFGGIAMEETQGPVYVLVDCGYKPGSPKFLPNETSADDVVENIKKVTGGHINVAVITHEHQDHVNAITDARFKDITIGEVWLAWTESESDDLANALRRKHKDTLKTLAMARNRLAASADTKDLAKQLEEFMSLEIGGEGIAIDGALARLPAAKRWNNKDSIELFRNKSVAEPRCLYPHQEIIALSGAEHVRAFTLGPPHDEDAISDLDPQQGEAFPKNGLAVDRPLISLASALESEPGADPEAPFSRRFGVKLKNLSIEPGLSKWFRQKCGSANAIEKASENVAEVAENAKFRRIDRDWLLSVETLALAMGNDTNNSSLVLAFELKKGGKVLLFVGDAQRGSWASWAAKPFKDGDTEVDVKELLGRSVLYKVGHHDSHNATLNGTARDDHPNLAWLGRGKYASEFTALIPAVRKWAIQPSIGWDHPLQSIKTALMKKCQGRVLQTDTNLGPEGLAQFGGRAAECSLYFDLRIDPN